MEDRRLVAKEEEGPVSAVIQLGHKHRSAQRTAKLVSLDGVAAGRRPIACVKIGVAYELEQIAAQFIGPGPCDYVDHRPRISAVLRTVAACLHAELLQ